MTDFPAITALPTPPARGQDPAVFTQRADAIIDAIANTFIAQLNAFGPQLSQAIQERVTNAAAVSYQGAADAKAAAFVARDAAQQYAASISPEHLVQSVAGKVGNVSSAALIAAMIADGALAATSRSSLTNQNIGPTYAEWQSASFSPGTSLIKSRTGASGWGLSLLRNAAQPVPVIQTGYRVWPKSVDLTFSFIAWTASGNATIMCDLYPDTLPEQYFYLSPTPRLCTFVVNSALADMDSATMRFFVYDGDAQVTVFVTDIKIEYGAQPSPWVRGEASAADLIGNVPACTPTTSAIWRAAKPVALVDAALIGVDLSTFLNATVTLGGNRTLASPANVKPGQAGVIEIFQDATGGRTLAFGSGWSLGSIVPTVSTAANARDVLYYQVLGDGRVDAYLSKGR